MTKEPTDKVVLAEIKKDIGFIKSRQDEQTIYIREIKDKMEKDYVTQDEFKPIRNLVYGMVSIVLTGVVGALLALVIKQ